MAIQEMSMTAPVARAIAIGATTPDPGSPGVRVWSTTALKTLEWNGSQWTDPSEGSGGSGPNYEFAIAALGGL